MIKEIFAMGNNLITSTKRIIALCLSICFSIYLVACSGPEKAPQIKSPIDWVNEPSDLNISFDKTTFLLFLTDGCDGCAQLTSSLQKITEQFGDKLAIIGVFTPQVNTNVTKSEANTYLKKLAISYPVILDNNANILNAYQINGWPTLILINKKGEVKKRIYGVKNEEFLYKLVQVTINEDST